MKNIILLILLSICLPLQAQIYKVNSKKQHCRPFNIQIESTLTTSNKYQVIGNIIQEAPFSFKISFNNVSIILPDDGGKIEGSLIRWDKDRNFDEAKTVNDVEPSYFALEFPLDPALENAEVVDFQIGNIVNSDETPIIVKNIRIKKAKKK